MYTISDKYMLIYDEKYTLYNHNFKKVMDLPDNDEYSILTIDFKIINDKIFMFRKNKTYKQKYISYFSIKEHKYVDIKNISNYYTSLFYSDNYGNLYIYINASLYSINDITMEWQYRKDIEEKIGHTYLHIHGLYGRNAIIIGHYIYDFELGCLFNISNFPINIKIEIYNDNIVYIRNNMLYIQDIFGNIINTHNSVKEFVILNNILIYK